MENEKLSVVRQVVEEGFGNADLYLLDQLISENCIEHQFGMNGGREGLKKAVISLTKAFSNRNYELINYSLHENIVWGIIKLRVSTLVFSWVTKQVGMILKLM
jgi:hypothetical protein